MCSGYLFIYYSKAGFTDLKRRLLDIQTACLLLISCISRENAHGTRTTFYDFKVIKIMQNLIHTSCIITTFLDIVL